ncbi:oxidoreductase [Niallia circulans]|jgi:predicted dehydrogenase|uniref:Gfo/Idh/MocA family protein n=1 Tax=Niallia circulans TaxID=1397 RepID=UPI00077CCEC2|nr:Gfo/Idh/MocA family oxidoreductase [Niallia circulans]MDR4319035.1 Gfo/Idh/MocA family oxidoreductase [Niallia circulans]MED3840957.1 Gfo/Idh/MocA family oxidoreductase [Niallia circulans]MED4245886.1 Gfo/Idh/MocA family oxidoreductase [Niallia circulans]MED4247740.1 Gfo/Idh/MocA family oxidoreductase [Niallia circulans]MED5100924.1 Gfo/Idh/MocA family oxidoreductase [Niallia circulans]
MKKIENEVRWGIIGCGDVTEVKSGPGFQLAENSKLVAVMRRNGELAKDYAERHHVPKWYDNGEALINDPDVDAVYVATPPAFHKEYALLAAKAGKPVYVEKPMARNYQECLEMIEACKRADVPLFVAYYRRALPRFLKIKEIVDSGVLGDIRFVRTIQYQPPLKDDQAWRVQPELAGGGLFLDLASHTLDILDFLLGPIKEAEGFATNQNGSYEAEDMVTGNYLFESGVHGTGTWCFGAYDHVDENEIVGSKGKLTFATFGNGPITLTTSEGTEEWVIENPRHIQQPMIQLMVDELTGKGTSPSTGESGARTNWVMDQLIKGYYGEKASR